MPNRRVHLKFDLYLKEHGVIHKDVETAVVHDRMDRDVKKFGSDHRWFSLYHREEGVREWLRKWAHLAYQDTLTDYLRVALGHLVLDDIASRYPNSSEDQLIKSAYRSFIQRGFRKCFFRTG